MEELKPIALTHGLNLSRLRDYNKALRIWKEQNALFMRLMKELNIKTSAR